MKLIHNAVYVYTSMYAPTNVPCHLPAIYSGVTYHTTLEGWYLHGELELAYYRTLNRPMSFGIFQLLALFWTTGLLAMCTYCREGDSPRGQGSALNAHASSTGRPRFFTLLEQAFATVDCTGLLRQTLHSPTHCGHCLPKHRLQH